MDKFIIRGCWFGFVPLDRSEFGRGARGGSITLQQ